MLKNISGVDYLVVIALLVALYYLIIILFFYSNELKEILKGKRKLSFKSAPEHIEFLEQDYSHDSSSSRGNEELVHKPFVETSDETFEEVEQLITGLQFLIASHADEKIEKAEFVSRISSLLQLHPDLKNSLFIPVINELIMAECEKYKYVLLTEEEILELW